MIGIAALSLLCLWLFIIGFLATRDHWICYLLAVAVFVVPMGSFFQYLYERDQKFPCVQYETRMQYNPALKTTAPVRVCAERGEWVD